MASSDLENPSDNPFEAPVPSKPAPDPAVDPAVDPASHPSKSLLGVGYLSLVSSQFFGAANDNILKQCLMLMVATGGIWADALGSGGQVVPALCLTLPFILLSGYAGQISDKYSKQQVMLWVKIAEVPIAILAFIGFYSHSLWLTIMALVLLSIQSSFFGPAKYGVISEITKEEDLSLANGIINMFSNIAVIAGSLLAGPICDWFHPEAAPGAVGIRWAPGIALVAVSILGLLAMLPFPKQKRANSDLVFHWNPFSTYLSSIFNMGPALFAVVIAWAAFYMIGMIALLILPEYKTMLNTDYTTNSYLLGILAIAIGIGSAFTGWLSRGEIKPMLIPVGASGMTIAFFLLGTLPPVYASVAILIFVAGFFAGFYIVPLQALIQYLAPDDERGQVLGTSNAISFCFSTLGPVIFWLASKAGMPPNRIFLICALFALIGTIYGFIELKKLLKQTSEASS